MTETQDFNMPDSDQGAKPRSSVYQVTIDLSYSILPVKIVVLSKI